MPGVMNLESVECARCENGFEPKAKIVNCNGELFCSGCFVCAQCFRPFPDGVFYEFEERKYCEHCFHVLYAPCCAKCGEFIIGRVIKAMQQTWHPECFTCEMCHKELADLGFIKNQGRALCHDCNAKVKAAGVGKYMCQKCRQIIEGEPLRFRGEYYCPYHFNCAGRDEKENFWESLLTYYSGDGVVVNKWIWSKVCALMVECLGYQLKLGFGASLFYLGQLDV